MTEYTVTNLLHACLRLEYDVPDEPGRCSTCDAVREIDRLRTIGDALAEQIMQLLGPLSTDADPATVERHQSVRNGALRQWAEVRRG